jgi:YVTN family beta-propeller protein
MWCLTTYTSVTVQVAPTPSQTAPTTSVPVAVGSGPSGAAVSNGFAYVINYHSNDISVINTATKQVVKTLDGGAGPLSGTASPQGTVSR